MVHLFDSLVRTIPDGVILTSIKQEGDKLTLEGRSQSNARVSTYMRNLEGSGWMTKPDLSHHRGARQAIRACRTRSRLSVMLANPNAPKDENGGWRAAMRRRRYPPARHGDGPGRRDTGARRRRATPEGAAP